MKSRIQDIQDSVPKAYYQVDIPIQSLRRSLDDYEIDMNPEYQRDYVWTQEQQEKFVGALIEDSSQINPLIFNFKGKSITSGGEIVDGKQRIHACLRWLNNHIPERCPCGETFYYDDLTEIDKSAVMGGMRVKFRCKWVMLNRKDVMKYYLRLNSGGTVHTDDELQKVKRLLEVEQNK